MNRCLIQPIVYKVVIKRNHFSLMILCSDIPSTVHKKKHSILQDVWATVITKNIMICL